MSATLERLTGVPRESLGQARTLRNTLITHDTAATIAIQRIIAPLKARTIKGSIPRPELVTDAARLWREQLAGPGRLALDITQTPKRLVVRELRLSAADFRLATWTSDEAEPGFAVLIVELSLQRRTCSYTSVTLASLSLHSAARWFQRNFDTSQAALAGDVSMLAAAIRGIDLTPDTKFLVPVEGGRWAGTVYEIRDDEHLTPVLAVRTFLTD